MPIRFASIADIEDIMFLIEQCIQSMESQGIYQWDDSYPTAEIFADDIKSNSLFVFEDGGSCMGIISLNENQAPEYQELIWENENGKILVIHRLAVNPGRQKQGIGRRLMDFAEDYAADQGYASIRLDAYSGNPRAASAL